jgi:hypothetical protein
MMGRSFHFGHHQSYALDGQNCKSFSRSKQKKQLSKIAFLLYDEKKTQINSILFCSLFSSNFIGFFDPFSTRSQAQIQQKIRENPLYHVKDAAKNIFDITHLFIYHIYTHLIITLTQDKTKNYWNRFILTLFAI